MKQRRKGGHQYEILGTRVTVEPLPRLALRQYEANPATKAGRCRGCSSCDADLHDLVLDERDTVVRCGARRAKSGFAKQNRFSRCPENIDRRKMEAGYSGLVHKGGWRPLLRKAVGYLMIAAAALGCLLIDVAASAAGYAAVMAALAAAVLLLRT